MLLTVGRSYVGNDVTPSTLLDRMCACSYKNLPKYRSYRVSNTAPWGRVTNAVGTIFRKIFVGTLAGRSNNVECVASFPT